MAGIPTIGAFDKRVSFQTPTKVSDGAGGYTESYATLLSCYAHVKEAGGSRYFENATDGITDKKTIYVLHQDALYDELTPDTYVVYGGKEYSINFYSLINETKKIIRFDVSAA
jgi:SPP1 family predicted phage head-tail adaptor